MKMNVKEIENLIKLMEKSTLSELEITEGEETIRLSRHISNSHKDNIARPSRMHERLPRSSASLLC